MTVDLLKGQVHYPVYFVFSKKKNQTGLKTRNGSMKARTTVRRVPTLK
jgi:hypothetical protein